jgi:gamma-glutamyl phosphate reductase
MFKLEDPIGMVEGFAQSRERDQRDCGSFFIGVIIIIYNADDSSG